MPTDPKPSNSFIKYGNFALQLFAAMAVAGWLGHKVDLHFEFDFPVFLLLFALIVFGGMLYQMYNNLKNE